MAIKTYCMLIDIKRDIFEIIRLKPIDTGNKLHIRFSEDGKPVDLTGQTVKFMAIKPDNKGVYNFAKILNAKAGEVEVEITNQMTAVDGELACEIEIEGDELITTLTFYITIDHKLNDGNFIESTNEFTVLQKAIRDAYDAIDLMEQKTDAKLEELQNEVDTAISDMNETTDTKLEQVQTQVDTAIRDMNTTTDNKLSQVQSQVDTAISNMNSTTNNKLSQLQSQVDTAISDMNETTDTKLEDLQSQVTTAINGMNSKTDTKLTQVQTQVDNKLTDIQGQFNTLDSALTKKVNDKITEVTSTQNTLTNKVDTKIADIQSQFDTLETELVDIVDDKITEVTNAKNTLTSTVNSKITEHTNTINTKVSEVNSKISGYDNKIAEVNTTVSNANSTVNTLKQDVATAIAGIDDKIAGTVADKADINHNHDTAYLGKTAKAESAKTADAVAWANVSGKPSTFTPATHNHDGSYLPITGGTVSGTIDATNLQVEGANVYTTSRKPTPADIGASATGHTHNYAGSSSAGGSATSALACTGNSATATKLATARTINGTSFNGSANITTANWGTARTITIGSTGKSVNGSGNVSWSLSEIGAAASSHTHSYLPLSGGTLTGALTTNSNLTAKGGVLYLGQSSNSSWVGFYDSSGTRKGYIGKGSPDSDYIYLTADTSKYIVTIGHFCPSATGTYYLGANSPKMQWKGVCCEGGTLGTSDARAKENIERLDGTLVSYDEVAERLVEYKALDSDKNTRAIGADYYNFIKDRFKPSYYNYKLTEHKNEETGEYVIPPEEEYKMLKNVGFLAQDYDLATDKVAQEFIIEGADGTLSYNHMSYVTVGMVALQEAIKEIEKLKAENKALNDRLTNIEKHLGIS